MIIFLAIVLITLFLAISAIHFYWVFGGKNWANMAFLRKSKRQKGD